MSKYLYLDDEPLTNVRAYKKAVEAEAEGLSIIHRHPKPYKEQINELHEASTNGNLEGLILDLRLDMLHEDDDDTKEKANYRAATLAQEIRTRATEGDTRAYPIVLWSTNEKLRKSYDADDTSHDLFDLKSVKDDILEPASAKRMANKLVALVEGYATIDSLRSTVSTAPFKMLGLDEEPVFVDNRIYSHLKSQLGPLPTHEYARFIIRELLDTSGPLIDEWVLAARLGIDLGDNHQKSPGFNGLVEKLFGEALYVGPFNKGWSNWWFTLVDEAWRKLPDCPGALRNISAEARVEFLQRITGITNIVAAKAEFPSEKTTFWTVCKATNRPLDPRDGYLIDKQPKYPWQDRDYVSFSAVLSRATVNKKIRLDALEEDRYKRTKSKLIE